MRSAREEFDTDYVDETHMKAFAEALRDEDIATEAEDGLVTTPGSALHPPHKRVRKVSALSDFAPVNQRVTRRRKKGRGHDRRTEWTYILVRWPLLFFIFAFISFEFGMYVLIRQLVNTKEWLSAWRGKKGKLRKNLRAAKSYQEWKDAAAILDQYLEFDEWKAIDEDPYYDWRLVRKVRRSLKVMREEKDVRGVVGVLETCLRTNFAGLESARLYSETFFGTKTSIEAYISELEKALEYVRESGELSTEEKRRFFKSANTNLGTSALCLSGGASFGYYHFGVAKAFLEADLLPRVITGTSAGGLVAALLCTRTDEELRQILIPELACKITACEEPFSVWSKRVWKTGARFDSTLWARKCSWFTRGSTTFKEAYMRTGRILNISVTPADRHSPTKLLNYLTTPDTVIWSALLASAAVPGIMNPVVLMQKLKDGRLTPWNWGSKFKDGSLRVDIPLQALNLYFNVTHPVVSQVNPHVHLFFFAPRGSAGKPVAHRKGKGWRGNFLLSAAEQWLKLELTKNFKVIRDLELLPQLLGQDWSSVFLQRFDGAVTIWPKTRLADWLRILTDPDEIELERMLKVGQSVTWPKLHMIENRSRLERQILLGRQTVRKLLRAPAASTSKNAHSGTQEPIAGMRLPLPYTPSADVEMPMSMDTDAETAFAKGAEYFFRSRRSRTASPHPDMPLAESHRFDHDYTRRDLRRRKVVSNLFESPDPSANRSPRPATPDPPPDALATSPHPELISPPSPSTFFSRLRNQSFQKFSSPFASMRRTAGEPEGKKGSTSAPSAWSSDSSSDDDAFGEVRAHSSNPAFLGIDANQLAASPGAIDGEGKEGDEPEVDI